MELLPNAGAFTICEVRYTPKLIQITINGKLTIMPHCKEPRNLIKNKQYSYHQEKINIILK